MERDPEVDRTLAVLASALPIAWPVIIMQPAPSRPKLPGCEKEIHHREAVLDAFGVVLDTPRVYSHGAIRLANPARGFLDILRRNACYLCGPLRCPITNGLPDSVPSGRVARNVVLILAVAEQ